MKKNACHILKRTFLGNLNVWFGFLGPLNLMISTINVKDEYGKSKI